MTKIWVVAGFMAIIGIAQAQIQEPADKPLTKQLLIDSNPYFSANRK